MSPNRYAPSAHVSCVLYVSRGWCSRAESAYFLAMFRIYLVIRYFSGMRKQMGSIGLGHFREEELYQRVSSFVVLVLLCGLVRVMSCLLTALSWMKFWCRRITTLGQQSGPSFLYCLVAAWPVFGVPQLSIVHWYTVALSKACKLLLQYMLFLRFILVCSC